MTIKISHLDKLFTCFSVTVKYRHALADDKTYLYFTDYWFLLRYTVIIYKFTQGNLGTKKIGRSWFQSPVKKKNCKLRHWRPTARSLTRLAAASDKVYQLLAHGRWFSSGTPASSTTKTGRHDIAEILLKVTLNTKIQYTDIPTWRKPSISRSKIKTWCHLHNQ